MGGCSSKEALKEHMGRVGVGKHYAWCGFTPGRPVLIVPGFMSSALEIEHSEIQPSWQGERAWIDLAKLGVERLKHRGKCSATEPAKPPSPSGECMPRRTSPPPLQLLTHLFHPLQTHREMTMKRQMTTKSMR